jgi:YbbR domain-containing protein
MKFNLDNPWFTRVIAVFFAVLLFSFVSYENQSRIRSTNPTDGASINTTEVITNVPIDAQFDQDQYFISGMPDSATIRLEGPQAVITQTMATQSFNIVLPNLDELGPGTHTVDLVAEGLSSQLNYSIMPSEATITLEEKSVQEHEISVEFNAAAHLADGYTAGDPILSTDTVQITGAASTLENISDVLVMVMPEESDITDDIEMTLRILVMDSTGELLNVNTDPEQVNVTIPVEGTQRSVPIVLRESGTVDENYEYRLEIAQGEPENVVITGESAIIEEINNFPIEVDVSGVTESTVREVPLILPDGVTEVNPNEIDVVIRVSSAQSNEEEENTNE